jgi:hypothetical protein
MNGYLSKINLSFRANIYEPEMRLTCENNSSEESDILFVGEQESVTITKLIAKHNEGNFY